MAHGEIHIGDVGTVYQVPCYDDDLTPVNFDPSLATTKQLFFEMPGAAGTLTRTATAAQVTIDGASIWCLTYTVVPADVAAYRSETVGGFHQRAGKVKVQGYVVFSANQKWKSSIVTTDQQGRALEVVGNL